MHCHLLVSDLFWPERDFREIYRELDTPALAQLLTKGRRQQAVAASLEAWLGTQFGARRREDWPVAPYCLLADGGEPGAHHWLRADPVHLRLEGNRLILADSGGFSLSQQEAGSLADSLNAHFSADGLTFRPLRPERWYLRVEAATALQTTALPEAAGRSIEALLPRGADAPAWRARLNEVQMLLHDHAINAARESEGKPPINSVWLWGGGSISDAVSAPFDAVWSGNPFAAGLAQAAAITARDLPEGAAGLFRASAGTGVCLVVLDSLRAAAQHGDAHGWRDGLARLERDWFAPLLQALEQQRVGMVSLHALGTEGVLSAEVTRGDLRRFWRRVRPLADFAPA